MASTQRKSSADTTQRKLNTFFAQNIFFVFLLTISTVLFCLLSDLRYRQLGHQQMELHNFYRNLETLHSQLTAYAARGDDTILKAKETSLSCLKDSAKVLADIPVDAVYQRDMADTALMLDRYSAALDQVLSSLRPDRRNHSYYEADSIYSAINAGFRSLNFQILEHTNRKMETFQKTQRHFITLITLFLAFMIGADVIYSIRLSHSIVDPITELTTSIQGLYLTHVEDYREVSLFCASNQEMNILVSVFNSMIKTIQGQMEKIRENADIAIKLHQKEVENLQIANLLRTSQLKALQMQINPHFLFNTLNMISQTAYVEDAEQTSLLLDSTAALLRYALDSAAREVPLSKEMENLGIYVSLLEHRFGGRIRFTFDLDETFHSITVPALILQPLVENAITHGVGMYLKGGQVTIRTQYDAERGLGIISILDNGAGIGPEDLEHVRREMKESSHPEQKLGLSNVYARLRIFFHNTADMEITSIPNVETEVSIFLPWKIP
ncbi:MAG: histidine kinase [Hungatella sp.]|jgi:two-component system sensor histidine kinase YesM|nr:histidine kinase [Hungatella sp.]